MIRTYQAQHGGTVFLQTLTERQKRRPTRILALVVIGAIAASTATVLGFGNHASAWARAGADAPWTP